MAKGQNGQAAAILRSNTAQAPFCLEGNLMLARILATNNRAHAAGVHLARAEKYCEPGRLAFERASILRQQAKLPGAIAAFAEALAADPDNPTVAAAMVDSVEMAGELDQAKELADQARARFPQSAQVRRAAATVAAAQGDHAGAVMITNSAGEDLLPIEYLDRGRYYEKLGDHGQAWADWMAGKAMARDKLNHRYWAPYFKKHFAALRAAADPRRAACIRAAAAAPDGGPTPLFVTGFPRSGTTLMETILSSHSAVLAGDELSGMADVIEALPAFCRVRLPYPAAMMATSLGENPDVPDMLRELYIRGSRRRIGWEKKKGAKAPLFFTDKMPLNELHLPLIRALFPDAPILRMERHPLDVMVSCMSHWLPHGGFFAASLEDCARHYLAVDELFHHYRKSPCGEGGRLLAASYDDLAADPANEIPAVLTRLGLPLEKQCLAPHKNPRTARTISYNQVRQPISAGAVGRWKPYRAQLAPAVEILRPILERDGYDS
jgi:tetratricopeptide (TPR) repeat protein